MRHNKTATHSQGWTDASTSSLLYYFYNVVWAFWGFVLSWFLFKRGCKYAASPLFYLKFTDFGEMSVFIYWKSLKIKLPDFICVFISFQTQALYASCTSLVYLTFIPQHVRENMANEWKRWREERWTYLVPNWSRGALLHRCCVGNMNISMCRWRS